MSLTECLRRQICSVAFSDGDKFQVSLADPQVDLGISVALYKPKITKSYFLVDGWYGRNLEQFLKF